MGPDERMIVWREKAYAGARHPAYLRSNRCARIDRSVGSLCLSDKGSHPLCSLNLPLDGGIIYARIAVDLRRAGRPISGFDAQMAAIARTADAVRPS